MLGWLLFAAGSAAAVYISWPSFRDWRSHGFPRFFAFEALLVLAARNLRHWFQAPFAPRQLASWALLALSLGLAAHGFYLLRSLGRPQGAIENTTVLVRRGAYRYIRHPLYSSLLWFGLGAFLKRPDLAGGLLALLAAIALVVTARVEEAENRRRLGQAYAAYMADTKMFIPFLV